MLRFFIVVLFAFPSASFAGFYCTPDTNQLLTTAGVLIFDFDDQSRCREHLLNGTRAEFYCTVSDNRLLTTAGVQIYDFDDQSRCRDHLVNATLSR